MTTLTGETITDEEIRALRRDGEIGEASEHFALSAISDDTRRYYRARCAAIISARSAANGEG